MLKLVDHDTADAKERFSKQSQGRRIHSHQKDKNRRLQDEAALDFGAQQLVGYFCRHSTRKLDLHLLRQVYL